MSRRRLDRARDVYGESGDVADTVVGNAQYNV